MCVIMAHLSSNIFARLETLKKWQEEQQQRLLQQQTEQNTFLSNEQKRLNDAFEKNDIEETPVRKRVTINEPTKNIIQNVDDQLILSPTKDFNELLDEKLKILEENEVIVKPSGSKPKRPFLKKGTGLVKYRMGTPKKLSPKKVSVKPKPNKIVETPVVTERASWASVLQTPTSTPGQDLSLEQRVFEKQLERELAMKRDDGMHHDLDELKIFELLEQKALNSSFCSTSSLITRLLGTCTPVRSAPIAPQRILDISEEPEKEFKDESTWDSDEESESGESTLSESSSPASSIVHQYIDVATNTDIPFPTAPNTGLLRIRLEELEKEIETFRQENTRTARLRNDLNKERSKFEKEMNEQRKQMEEEKKRMGREKQLLNDKYLREMKNGSRKEREDLTALKNQVAAVKEELKLKESRYGASQARQRNQIRSLEKEIATIKAESEELRKQNGKLQAQIQQNNKKMQPPSDTKVLHEINKNLSLLTKQQRSRTLSGGSSPTSDKENEPTENDRIPERVKKTKNDLSKSSIDPSFESVARDYERVFGRTEPPPRMDGRASSDSFTEKTKPTVIADRVERLLPDGTREITYVNGNVKSISGEKVTMKYYNGDVKETNPDNATVRYYYAEANIWHTTYAENGLEVLEFPDGQVERRCRDGSTEVTFPDGCIRCTSPLGTETVTFPDGTIVVNKPEGDKVLTLPNGQKEIHTVEHKRREYPDGTVKILYPDGTQETRYANGRIRLKDINGKLIMDTADVRCLDDQD